MKRLFIVYSYLLARLDIAQGKEQYVPVEGTHIGVRFTAVIDVMRAIAATTPIDTPDAVDIADAQLGAVSTALSFAIRDSLARVFGNLAPVRKMNGRKAASTVD